MKDHIMINAKDEFTNVLISNVDKRLKCAEIFYCPDYTDQDKNVQINLNVGYTDEEFKVFIKSLDFVYDNYTDKQKLFGLVWFQHSSNWTERETYGVGENWTNKRRPKIPNFLKRVK